MAQRGTLVPHRARSSAWPKDVLFDPCRLVRQLKRFARLWRVGWGKPLCARGATRPPGRWLVRRPLESGGKVARFLIARHKCKGIKGLRKVGRAKVTLPPGKVAN